jgi:uncharacterized hydrophobic protein (TIGR00271 family)
MRGSPIVTTTNEQGLPLTEWWREQVIASVDHESVVRNVREDSGWSAHFAFMISMSAGIAVLGLLLSSPAVVIGAMLISPLIGPIVGLGFALATFDSDQMRRSLRALVAGTALAVLLCALIVLLSPLQTVTSEIAARTRPNLFDLLIALFSGLAGSYAMIRGRHGTIVGVAIATALMPPIAVVGYGLATANWTVLAGSSLLFFTNLMTITASAAVLARLYGFAQDLSPQQTRLQATLVIGVLLALAVPLALSLKQIAWEAVTSRDARDRIARYFGGDARLSDVEIDYDGDPVQVTATVFTPRFRSRAEQQLAEELSPMLGREVTLSLEQVRTESEAAEAAELAAARGTALERNASRLAERLALIAGVPVDQVLVDGRRKRALVRATPLPGAGLAAYRALEARAADSEPDWSITIVPPPGSLPEVELTDGEPDAEALAIAAWAARRLRLPVGVAASSEAEAEAVVSALSELGVEARATGEADGDSVRLRWLAPAAQAAR